MIRLLLVDDHALFRQGLRELLSKDPELNVVAEAGSCAQAIDALAREEVDVVVADLSMPGPDGIDLIAHVHATAPRVGTLALTMHEDSEHANRALHSGALGYVTKAATPQELSQAIRTVAAGRGYVSPVVHENMKERFARSEEELLPHMTLSRREFRIFELLAQCGTTTRIAQQLELNVKTVSTYKARLLRKMGMSHQGELVRYAIEHKLAGN